MSSHMPGTPTRSYPPRPEAVYFYATCLVDMFVPEAGMDAITLLEREGIRVIFPDNQMKILPYNRVVKDLHGQTPEQFWSRVAEKFTVTGRGQKPVAGRMGVGHGLQGGEGLGGDDEQRGFRRDAL